MDKKSLQEKKASIEQQYNALQKDNENHQKTINNNNEEMLKLAGAFRLIDDLLNAIKESNKKGKSNG